jgi:hypothetical protein
MRSVGTPVLAPLVELGRRIELLASVWKTEVLPLYEPSKISHVFIEVPGFLYRYTPEQT